MRITTYIKPKRRSWCNIETYKCPICGNADIHSIGTLDGKPYCRRCISFCGEEVKHNLSYPKKAGGSQPIGTNNLTTSINGGKLTNEALTQKGHTPLTSIKSKHKKKGKRNG